MDRNTALAFALSMLVFAGYTMYQSQRNAEFALEQEAIAQQEAAADAVVQAETGSSDPGAAPSARTASLSSASAGAVASRPVTPSRAIAPKTSVLRNGEVEARISNGPALIESWKLKTYDERLPDGDVPIELLSAGVPIFTTNVTGLAGGGFENARYEVVRESAREVVQRATTGAGVLTRTIRLDAEGYGFDLDLVFESARTDPVEARMQIEIPAKVSEREDFLTLSLLAHLKEGGVEREPLSTLGRAGFFSFGSASPVERVDGAANWAGFDIQFFAGLLIDPQAQSRLAVTFEALEVGELGRTIAALPPHSVGSGGAARESLRGFLGPKTSEALAAENAGLEASIDRGWSWFEPLTRFFELALEWLYKFIPNYGWAIIVLTILVRMVTAPLMLKQMRSGEKMREVQPKLKALQERYADDRQKQSEEMMKLYREESINPLAGCFPLLLQMPILFGLFMALRSSIGLRHSPWILWFDDLSQPATMFEFAGFPVRLLPLIMAGSMYLQQKMMPQAGMDPVQARMMLIMMPGMMLLFSYTFPSGLVLYWTVSNLLGIAHQYWVRNHMKPA